MSNQNDTDQKVLAGILPVLQFMIGQHVDTAHKATTEKGVNIAKRPNSWENPQLFALDPYGNTDFFVDGRKEGLNGILERKWLICFLANARIHNSGMASDIFPRTLLIAAHSSIDTISLLTPAHEFPRYIQSQAIEIQRL